MKLELNETEIDGVPCYWVETGRPTLAASLFFRVGQADETLTESGWTHLLEHMALHGRESGTLHVNGSVSALLTTFDFHGPERLVVAALGDVTGWLSDPDLEDLARERRVLRAESEMRLGPAHRAAGWRYGARGPGTMAMGEVGLGRATPDLLRERAATVFNRGNAVLALDGPPPAGLRLQLSGGSRLPIRPAVPCEDKLPAAYVEESGLILTGVVPRSPGATALPDVLQAALRTMLRDGAGTAYAPWSHYEAVDLENALVYAGSDISGTALGTLVPDVLRLIKTMVRDGPDAEVVRHIREARLQALADPYQQFGLALRTAAGVLSGLKRESVENLLDETANLDEEAVHEAARVFYRTLLMGVPGATTWHGELPMIKQPTEQGRPRGRRFRHQDWPANPTRLVVAETAVHLTSGGQHTRYPYDDLEGLVAYADGGRHLVSPDGWGLTLNPTEWRNGVAAVGAVDRAVPTGKHLPSDAREVPLHAPRQSFLRRYGHGIARVALETVRVRGVRWLLAAVFIWCMIVTAIASKSPVPVIVMLALAWGLWSGLRDESPGGRQSDPPWPR